MDIDQRTLTRRRLLASVAAVPILAASADGKSISGQLPWSPFAGEPPRPVNPLGWYYFTPGEAAAVEAIVDRLIPADHLSPGGKDCGCAVYIDRQLAGSFGKADRLYTKPPFAKGLPTQGYQGDLTPAGRYRLGLRALNDHTHSVYKRDFVSLSHAQQDEVLAGLDTGKTTLTLKSGFSTKEFFELVLANTMEGFFADPLYGGNKGMASWKMIGFPGARYDYRDHIDKHNVPYPRGPVSILARPEMAKMLPRKDAVIIGLGWTGAILAQQLTDAGLNVVAIERGPWRDTATDFNIAYMQDELRYAIRKDLFLKPSVEAMTMRNDASQTAMPMRDYGSFLPGDGVGGAGVHWNGHTWRFWDSDLQIKSHLTQRYGAAKLKGLALQDWGVTWNELEQSFDKFEYLCGISGKAGNIKGQIHPGGNPFESARAREYPNPPMKMSYAPTLFAQTVTGLGYHPFPTPSANLSQAYRNPLGVEMGQCSYCGFCERFACGNYSKASAQTTILPVLMRKPNFELRTESEVLKINLHPDGKTARSVTYIGADGVEYEQPADMVLVCAYGLMNVRMLLLSKIGVPYDPATGEGTIGRNYCYQTSSAARMFFEGKHFNPFIGSGTLGQTMDDFNGDAFDHSKLDFLGGAGINCVVSNGRPIGNRPTMPGSPRWGAKWKEATVHGYQNAMGFSSQGSSYPVRGNYLDLDPTYTDRHGRPLLRMTFDFPDNDVKMSHYVSDQMEKMTKAFGAKYASVSRIKQGWDSVPYQSTHNTGGAVMGADPKTSAVNKYLQSWDVPNVFVIGASAFAHNAGMNPTGTVGALAFWAGEAITNQYIKNPGALVRA